MDEGSQGWDATERASGANPGSDGRVDGDACTPQSNADEAADPSEGVRGGGASAKPGQMGEPPQEELGERPRMTPPDMKADGKTDGKPDAVQESCSAQPPSRANPQDVLSDNANTKRHAAPRHASRDASSKAPTTRHPTPLFQVHSVSNFLSTSRIPRQLDTLVTKSLERNARLDHILIHGGTGSGTALLARALINDYAPPNVFEIDAALGCDAELLRRGIEEVGPRGVLFIRHIDAFGGDCDQIIAEALSGQANHGSRARREIDPTETAFDRLIAASASGRQAEGESRTVDFTIVATAHLMTQVGYIVRTRVEHMFHLRDDPKALRNAVLRSLRRQSSITVDANALPQLERVLSTLADSAEPITRAIMLRSACDNISAIGSDTMRSIIEEDLAARLPDEAYAASLRRHLMGRRIEQVTPEEVARIASETGWGTIAAQAALASIIRDDMRKRPT